MEKLLYISIIMLTMIMSNYLKTVFYMKITQVNYELPGIKMAFRNLFFAIISSIILLILSIVLWNICDINQLFIYPKYTYLLYVITVMLYVVFNEEDDGILHWIKKRPLKLVGLILLLSLLFIPETYILSVLITHIIFSVAGIFIIDCDNIFNVYPFEVDKYLFIEIVRKFISAVLPGTIIGLILYLV